MDFGAVLSKTWNISWRNKGLWILGILAGCSASGRGNFGNFSSSFNWNAGSFSDFSPPGEFGPPGELVPPGPEFLQDPDFLAGAVFPIILAFICVVLLVGLVFFVLGILGQGGLIAAFKRADEGAEVTFSESLSEGTQYFWRLLGIRIVFLVAAIVVGLIIAFGVLTFGIVTLGIGLLCLLPLLCLLIPLGMGVDAYVILTMVASIEEDLGVFESFGRSWTTFKENLGAVIVMILILILGIGILGSIVTLPFIAVIVPAITGAVIGTDFALASGISLTLLCVCLAIPLLIAFSGLLTTFSTGAWTLTYRRLNGETGAALPA